MSKHLIFVYGTLKRGWGNNAIIHDQECLGEAITVEHSFQMYTLGGFPGVVGGDKQIMGELWEVDDTAFDRCDRLEGHPRFYKRYQIEVLTKKLTGMSKDTAWIYIYQGDVSQRTPIKEWTHAYS
jgi:gamma-glutamylaminecyclotransferase